MDELHQRVVDRIRKLADERGIPITHLPERAYVGRSHFFGVMSGSSSPTLAWLARIAGALDVDVGDLVAAPPPPNKEPARAGGRERRT